MHRNNLTWLQDLKTNYPSQFRDCNVLELGSQNINGTARLFFDNCTYVGIDSRPGSGVDVVASARQVSFQYPLFSTLICLSMLEHDPRWRDSLVNGLHWLLPLGLVVLCWGAEGNKPHLMDWKLVPWREVTEFLESRVEIFDGFFEEDRYGQDCAGCYNLVGRCKLAA